jgi:hypothetical protein
MFCHSSSLFRFPWARPLFHQAAEEVIHFWCDELTTEDWPLGESGGFHGNSVNGHATGTDKHWR